MRLARALEDKNLDIRLRDKLIAEGKLSKEEVNNFLNSLPDDEACASYTGGEEEQEATSEEAPLS